MTALHVLTRWITELTACVPWRAVGLPTVQRVALTPAYRSPGGSDFLDEERQPIEEAGRIEFDFLLVQKFDEPFLLVR